jgi:ketosteroid isomerase-like protein
MIRPCAAFLVLLLGATAVGRGQTRNDPTLAQVVMDLQRQEDDAEAHGDAAALGRVLADDFFAVTPTGDVEHKAEYIARITRLDPRPAAIFQYSAITVRAYGDTALATYRVDFKYPNVTAAFRITVVWVKQGETWRTVTWAPTLIR